MSVVRRSYPTRLVPFTGPAEPTPGMMLPSTPEQKTAIPRVAVGTEDGNGYVKFFRFYGFDLHKENMELVGGCIFPDCQKEGHFYANYGTGQWKCQRCQRTGNIYSFLPQFHQACLQLTTDANYLDLTEQRAGIPPWVFKEWQLAINCQTGEWMLPAWSMNKELSNLYIWRQFYIPEKETHEWQVRSGPTLKQLPYGLQFFKNKRDKPLYILEGHWDTLAFWGLMAHVADKGGVSLMDSVDILGQPGSAGIPKEHLHLLDGRDVRLINDNDKAGRDGVDAFVKKLAQNNTLPNKFGVLEWPKEFCQVDAKGENIDPRWKGYDLRDLIAKGIPTL